MKKKNNNKIVLGVIGLFLIGFILFASGGLGAITATWGITPSGYSTGSNPIGLTLSDDEYDLKVVSWASSGFHSSCYGVAPGNHQWVENSRTSDYWHGATCLDGNPIMYGSIINTHLISNNIDLGSFTFNWVCTPMGDNAKAVCNWVKSGGDSNYNALVSASASSSYCPGCMTSPMSYGLTFNGFTLKNPKVELDTKKNDCVRTGGQVLIEQVFDKGSISLSDLKYEPDKLCLSVPAVLTKPSGATYSNRDVVLELARDGVTSDHPGETMILFYIATPKDVSTFCKGETEIWDEEEGKCQVLLTGEYVEPEVPDVIIVCERGYYSEEEDACIYTAQTQPACPSGSTYNEVSLRCEIPINYNFCPTWSNDFDWESRECIAFSTFDPDHPTEGGCPSGTSEVSREESGEIFILTCSDGVVLSNEDICGSSDYEIDVSAQACVQKVTVVSTPTCSSNQHLEGGLCIANDNSDSNPATCPVGTQLSEDGKCLSFPMDMPTNNDYGWVIWVLAGIAVIGGIYYFLSGKKRKW